MKINQITVCTIFTEQVHFTNNLRFNLVFKHVLQCLNLELKGLKLFCYRIVYWEGQCQVTL